jgi:murein DD-endopeptidase MepM/ murein hydrolase activator NlpD
LATLTAQVRARALADVLLRAHANLVFSGSRSVGALLFLATLTEPRYAALGVSAALGAHVASRALAIDAGTVYAPYAYNALLVGFGIANAHRLDVAALSFALALGALSAFVTAALSSWLGRIAALPVLSLPFLLVSNLAAGALPYWPLSAAPPALDTWAAVLPAPISLTLQSFGAILFLPRVLAGIVVFTAVVRHSRIAAMLALGGIACALILASIAHVPPAERLLLASSFNAALTAIAVGGVWFVPSRSSFALGLGSAVLAVFLTFGLSAPLARLGLQTLVLPFNLAVVIVLFAMRQRSRDGRPYAANLLSATPEDALLAFHLQGVRDGSYGLTVDLPFRGLWTCTQGVDGAFTHKGIWRHGFDFEVHAEPGGTLCLGQGGRVEDYHCFRLPVLAAADGTVVGIENDIADSAVGSVNDQQPWGNRVTIHHGDGIYSTVAHLARGSVAVWLGQVVRGGDLLGRCGSSGRSPRPHLHFQLQTGPSMLSPTLPCRFTSAVVRAPEGERLESDVEPVEGIAVRNLEPDVVLRSYFEFPLGQTMVCVSGRTREPIVCEVDRWGRLSFGSRKHGATLAYRRSDDAFVASDITGPHRSVLHLLRFALSRVPFERGTVVQWTDRVPRQWAMGPLGRALWSLAAPFIERHDIEISYRRSWEGDRVVVAGASIEQHGGAPRVVTRAVLRRGCPELVEVIVRGRARRVGVTLGSGEVGSRIHDTEAPTPPMLSSVGDPS